MNYANSINDSDFFIINDLICNNNYTKAESILNKFNKNHKYYYLYSIIYEKRAWFDSALEYINKAISLDPNNTLYKERLHEMSCRHRRYSDDYYDSGYRRRRGCSCCCCDDCCCDCGNFSCCDLICLDQCCECMGGDLIDCI